MSLATCIGTRRSASIRGGGGRGGLIGSGAGSPAMALGASKSCIARDCRCGRGREFAALQLRVGVVKGVAPGLAQSAAVSAAPLPLRAGEARRILLRAQGLLGAPPSGRPDRRVRWMLERVGAVQLDT